MKYLKKFEMLIRPDITQWRDDEGRRSLLNKWVDFDLTKTSPDRWTEEDFQIINSIIEEIKPILTDIGCRVETSHHGSAIQYSRQPLNFKNFKEYGVPFLVIHNNIPDPMKYKGKNNDIELGFYYWLDEFLDRLEDSLPDDFMVNVREVFMGYDNVDKSKMEVIIYKKA